MHQGLFLAEEKKGGDVGSLTTYYHHNFWQLIFIGQTIDR
jgi:hypothetical protein